MTDFKVWTTGTNCLISTFWWPQLLQVVCSHYLWVCCCFSFFFMTQMEFLGVLSLCVPSQGHQGLLQHRRGDLPALSVLGHLGAAAGNAQWSEWLGGSFRGKWLFHCKMGWYRTSWWFQIMTHIVSSFFVLFQNLGWLEPWYSVHDWSSF